MKFFKIVNAKEAYIILMIANRVVINKIQKLIRITPQTFLLLIIQT